MNDEPTLYSQMFLEAFEHIKWMAQTVHQAHHQDQEGTYRSCPLSPCKATQELVLKWAEANIRDAKQSAMEVES